jgi:hypothetical protein
MAPYASIRPHTSAYVSIRQHTSAPGVGGGVSMALYVSIRQHTSAYVSTWGRRRSIEGAIRHDTRAPLKQH